MSADNERGPASGNSAPSADRSLSPSNKPKLWAEMVKVESLVRLGMANWFGPAVEVHSHHGPWDGRDGHSNNNWLPDVDDAAALHGFYVPLLAAVMTKLQPVELAGLGFGYELVRDDDGPGGTPVWRLRTAGRVCVFGGLDTGVEAFKRDDARRAVLAALALQLDDDPTGGRQLLPQLPLQWRL